MAQAPAPGQQPTPEQMPQERREDQETIGTLYAKSQQGRMMASAGIGAVAGIASYMALRKRMGAKSIAVAAVVAVVAYMGSNMYLPPAQVGRYGT